ncbi:MAG: 2-hydroxy-6-ketonona-2,4-dienedioic acid hydrolase, partial [Spirochaetia bacterium]|nr:2-hydroxy-6-ketonona-2,4-dienedioic acid hydrolase [Spirochaetia bacterium]
ALDFPSAVTSLVLNGPGGVGTTRAFPTEGLNCLLDYYNGKGPTLEKMRTFIKEYLVYDSSSVSEKVIQERYESSIDPEVMASPPLRRPNGIPDFRKWDFTRDPRLNECRIPSLIIWGIEDKVNRPSGAEMLQSRMKNCDVYLFSKTGHWVQWERPEEFNGVTLSFLNCSTPKVK